MILTKSKAANAAATAPKAAGAKQASPPPSAAPAGKAGGDGRSPTDVATALALERAREVLRNGGTKEEATAAAKEGAREILQKQQAEAAAKQKRPAGAGATRRRTGAGGLPPAGAIRTGFMSKFRKRRGGNKKSKSKGGGAGAGAMPTAAGLTVESAGKAPAEAARDDVETAPGASKASDDKREGSAPSQASDKGEKEKGGVFKRTRGLAARGKKKADSETGSSDKEQNDDSGKGKGKKNAKSVRWGFRPNTPESASVAWTSYDHSYTTSGESPGEEDSFGYDENPTFMSENPTFMSQVSQDVSIYEGAIPSVFIRSNISQDVR